MLTERLKVVKNLVENSITALDVGTDHGYVPICLIKEKRAKKVIAADINKGPLENAEKNIRLNGLSDKIELRLGGGLIPVEENEVDTVIIAGMGGILISEILEESRSKAIKLKNLVLQPMNSQEDLRKYLNLNGYKIVKEKLARENKKIYNILSVRVEEDKPYEKESYYFLGRPENFDLNDDLTRQYIDLRRKQFEAVIKNLSRAKRNVEEEIEFYKEILKDTEDFYG